MRLFYTYAGDSGYDQKDPTQSLGGCRSETPVPNGRLNNLFGDLSKYSLYLKRSSIIGLILRNEIGDVSSLKFWFNLPDPCICNFEISLVTLNSEGRMEVLNSTEDLPYYSEFVSANGDINQLVITKDFLLNDQIGIWVHRSFNDDVVKSILSIDSLIEWDKAIVNNDEVSIEKWSQLLSTYEEKISLNIDWVLK